jgi:hypothetical protein
LETYASRTGVLIELGEVFIRKYIVGDITGKVVGVFVLTAAATVVIVTGACIIGG